MNKITTLANKSLPESSVPMIKSITEKYGFTPNLIQLLAHNTHTLQSALAFGGAFDSEKGGLTSEERHIVMLTTSKKNYCDYCQAAHTTAGSKAGVSGKDIRAVLKEEPLESAKLNALVNMVRSIVATKGRPTNTDMEAFFQTGYQAEQLLAIIHGVAYKTLTNYVNHIFDIEIDQPFADTLDSVMNNAI